MSIMELGHVVLYVAELERSRRFYRDALEFREIFVLPQVAAAYSSGRTHHELMLLAVGPAQPVPTGRRVGVYHIGFKVGDTDDALRAVLVRLHKFTVPLIGASDHGVTHSLYMHDPDGNEIELYIDVPGVDWRSDPSLAIGGLPRPLRL